MSIFGTTEPKFTSGATTVNLDYTLLDPKWPIPEIIEAKSPITGKKTFTLRGDYAEFDVLVHLSKYGSGAATKAATIYGYHGQLVKFYPFRDGFAVKNSAGSAVDFLLLVESGFKDDYCEYDILKLKFIATAYIDITESIYIPE